MKRDNKKLTLAETGSGGPKLLMPEDVAEFTGLSVETLAQWRSQRRGLPFLKIARNRVRYRQQDLDEWLEKRIVRVEELSPTRRRN